MPGSGFGRRSYQKSKSVKCEKNDPVEPFFMDCLCRRWRYGGEVWRDLMQDIIGENIQEQIDLLRKIKDSTYCNAMEKAAECILSAIRAGKKILIAGNGGSAADAQHFAAELVVRFERERPGLPALALTTDTSVLSAGGNDYGFEAVYERQVQALGNPGDVFIAISTSGSSRNIVRAARMAGKRNMCVVGLTGKDGGELKECSDILLCVPHTRTARIQEIHEHTIHTLCQMIEEEVVK